MAEVSFSPCGSPSCKVTAEPFVITATACSPNEEPWMGQMLGRRRHRVCQGQQKHSAAATRSSPVPSLTAFGIDDVGLFAPHYIAQVASPLLSQQHGTVPFNQPLQVIDFETPTFVGKFLVMFRNMANTPHHLFEGKRRTIWMTIQGQFKQPVPMDSLMVGSTFERPLKLPASSFLLPATRWLVQKMGIGVQLDPTGDSPHIFAPLIGAAQVINVSKPGQEPDMLSAEENMMLYDGSLASGSSGKVMSARQRKAFFACKAKREGRYYDTEHVWTFQLYDQNMDYSTFMLPIPLFKLDLIQVLDGQPMQLMLRDISSGTDMMRFEVWHKRMLQHAANVNSNVDAHVEVQQPDTPSTPAAAGLQVDLIPRKSDCECDSLCSQEYSCCLRKTSSYSSCCSSHDHWE